MPHLNLAAAKNDVRELSLSLACHEVPVSAFDQGRVLCISMFVTYGRVLGYAYHCGHVGDVPAEFATLQDVVGFSIFGLLVLSVLGVAKQHKSVYLLLLQTAA